MVNYECDKMIVYCFPDVQRRALMREAEIDGGHEVNITPTYVQRWSLYSLCRGADSPTQLGKTWSRKGDF